MVFLRDMLRDWRTWAVLFALLTWWLFSGCEKQRIETYVCKAGQHDFKPSPVPFPFAAKTMTGWAAFDASCWYNTLGEDNADWNKLAGVYRWADVVKNKNSFILAWRPDMERPGLFQLCLYENIDGANVPQESSIYKVQAGQGFVFHFIERDGIYTMYVNDILIGRQQNGRPYRTIGKISAWFGGNRTAPHDMSLRMDY